MYMYVVWTLLTVLVAVGFAVLVAASVAAIVDNRRSVAQIGQTIPLTRLGARTTSIGKRAA